MPPPPQSVRCATAQWEPSEWLPGAVKHGSRAGSALVIERHGVDEVLWVDRAGNILEGTRSNVFAVLDGVLVTPPLDGRLLAGVTRQMLLEMAPSVGVPVAERALPADAPFDELYVSSTLKELCPVVELDGAPAAGGGPVGARVSKAFADWIASLADGQ